jgi:hypothetical protein
VDFIRTSKVLVKPFPGAAESNGPNDQVVDHNDL